MVFDSRTSKSLLGLFGFCDCQQSPFFIGSQSNLRDPLYVLYCLGFVCAGILFCRSPRCLKTATLVQESFKFLPVKFTCLGRIFFY